MRAIQVATQGGPEVLAWVELDDPIAASDQLVVDVEASGVNYIDTYQRGGLYQMQLPYIAGVEGAGTVSAVGDGVTGFAVGDRVAWSSHTGSYSEKALVPASVALKLPDRITTELAAAVLLQGMTAHYLVCSTFPLEAGHRCLVHAGAGGTGLLLIQMAKMRGAEVFTTVGSDQKGELAAGAGADHVINYRNEDFGEAVERGAGPKSLDVIYDGVGADTFDRGLELLRRRGTMVTFGNASGAVPPVAPLKLSAGGSLFLTRPTLNDYTSSREELEWRASDVFGWVADGRLDVRIGARFPMADAAQAHIAIEGRGTTGKLLLVN